MLQTEDRISNIFEISVDSITNKLCFKFSSYRILINTCTLKTSKKSFCLMLFYLLHFLEFIKQYTDTKRRLSSLFLHSVSKN